VRAPCARGGGAGGAGGGGGGGRGGGGGGGDPTSSDLRKRPLTRIPSLRFAALGIRPLPASGERWRKWRARHGYRALDSLHPSRYACRPNLSAAIQVRQWSCGIGMWVEPRNLKASFTALAKHGTPPTLGLSPTPLAPMG